MCWKHHKAIAALGILLMIFLLTSCEPDKFADFFFNIAIVQGEGTTSPAPGRHGPYEWGEAVNITALPAEGWKLEKVVLKNKKGIPSSTAITEEHFTWNYSIIGGEVEAFYDVYFIQNPTPSSFIVTAEARLDSDDSEGGGEVSYDPYEDSFTLGTAVTLLCQANNGYVFKRWDIYTQSSGGSYVLDSSTTVQEPTITITANTKAVAIFDTL